MKRANVPKKVYRENDPGLRRLVIVASYLPPLQLVGEAAGLVTSTAIGVAGVHAGLWVIRTQAHRVFTELSEVGLAWGFFASLCTGMWIVSIVLATGLWFMAVGILWPVEHNHLALAFYGPPE